MFPLRDNNKPSTFPFINYILIAINIVVFYVQFTSPDFDAFIIQYSFIPSQFNFFNTSTYLPILSAMFMHGSLIHIVSNLWFLHIFGDNVEDRFGHIRYLLFYLMCGFVASMAQYLISPGSDIPTLGASGAIAGIAGAYFVFFKKSTILAIVPGFGLFRTIDISAPWFLGYWFLIQVVSGVISFGNQAGGVAWFAHIGGFVAGYLLAKIIPVKDISK